MTNASPSHVALPWSADILPDRGTSHFQETRATPLYQSKAWRPAAAIIARLAGQEQYSISRNSADSLSVVYNVYET